VQPEKNYEILPTENKGSVLDFVKKIPQPSPSMATSPTITPQDCSTSLSLSTEGSQEAPKEKKRSNHPLLKHRRSAASSSHSSSSVPTETSDSNLEAIASDSKRSQTMKQVRLAGILKKRVIASAQKTFVPKT
jgi:hypothetical protein